MPVLKKALFFDIDGTLISEQTGRIPNSTFEALTQAKEHGHLLFVNTGRTRCSIPPALFPLPFDGFLCGCGTELIYNGVSFYHQSLPSEEIRTLLKNFSTYDCEGILEASDAIYFPSGYSRFTEIEQIRHAFQSMGIAKTFGDKIGPVDKFIFFSDLRSDPLPLIESLSSKYSIIDRRNGLFEVVPRHHSKATAIRAILKKFFIGTENAYVFGDSTNDISMFECVPNAIAMGHHDKDLEPYCSYVTRTVEEGGVYHALKHFNLI